MPASGKPNIGYQDLVSLISLSQLIPPHGEYQPPLLPPPSPMKRESFWSAISPKSAKIYSDWMGLGHVSPPESVTEARGMLHAAGFSRVTNCTPESEKEVDPRMTTRALPR